MRRVEGVTSACEEAARAVYARHTWRWRWELTTKLWHLTIPPTTAPPPLHSEAARVDIALAIIAVVLSCAMIF